MNGEGGRGGDEGSVESSESDCGASDDRKRPSERPGLDGGAVEDGRSSGSFETPDSD